jgi:hypothetical protein
MAHAKTELIRESPEAISPAVMVSAAVLAARTMAGIMPAEYAQTDRASVPPASATVPRAATHIVDEWGMQSFPASDPPANW